MNLSMPDVECEHLYLRGLEEEDVADIFAYDSLEEVTRYLSFSKHSNIEQTLRILRIYYLPYEQRKEAETWCLVHKEHDKVIGHMTLHELEGDHAQIGYVLHPDYWGQGLMKEALPQLLTVGFQQLGLHRITAMVACENERSCALLKAIGMREEGRLKEAMKLSDGSYHDMILFAILEHEWRK